MNVGYIGDIALVEMDDTAPVETVSADIVPAERAPDKTRPVVARNCAIEVRLNTLVRGFGRQLLGNNLPCSQEVEIVKEKMDVTSAGIHTWHFCPAVSHKVLLQCLPAQLARDIHL